MRISFDETKRKKTLQERGIDFRDALGVFSGRTLTLLDDRNDYGGEQRYQTYGFLEERIVMVVWTLRGAYRRIISMRYCHDKEAKRVKEYLEG